MITRIATATAALMVLGAGFAQADPAADWSLSYLRASAGGTVTTTLDTFPKVTATGTLTSTEATGCHYLVLITVRPLSKPSRLQRADSDEQCGTGTRAVTVSAVADYTNDAARFEICRDDDSHCGPITEVQFKY